MTSGAKSWMALSVAGLRMSPREVFEFFRGGRVAAKRLGMVLGFEGVGRGDVGSEMRARRASQPPLKPVWPVRKTRLFCQGRGWLVSHVAGGYLFGVTGVYIKENV